MCLCVCVFVRVCDYMCIQCIEKYPESYEEWDEIVKRSFTSVFYAVLIVDLIMKKFPISSLK